MIQDNLLSCIVPCKNEEVAVGALLANIGKTFRDLSIEGEVIIINDGSTDSTELIVRRFINEDSSNYPNVRFFVVSNETSKGLGSAFLAGARHASSEYIVLIPGDGEISPLMVLKFFPALRSKADIIVPYAINRNARKLDRQLISKLFTRFVCFVFSVNFSYTNGAIIWRRSLYLELSPVSSGFFYQAEALILTKFYSPSLRIVQLPMMLDENCLSEGTSSALTFRNFREIAIRSYSLFWLLQKHKWISRIRRSSFRLRKLSRII